MSRASVRARRVVALLVGAGVFVIANTGVAKAWHLLFQDEHGSGAGCSRVVVFTLPGVTWEEVARVDPPHLMDAVEQGAMGSMAVRTITSRTSYASGFATLGAGSRMHGGRTTG
jgi:hypothetical protein